MDVGRTRGHRSFDPGERRPRPARSSGSAGSALLFTPRCSKPSAARRWSVWLVWARDATSCSSNAKGTTPPVRSRTRSGAGHDPRSRTHSGRIRPGRHPARGHQRQYRHRPGHGGGGAGIQARPCHARKLEPRTRAHHAGLWGRSHPDARNRRHGSVHRSGTGSRVRRRRHHSRSVRQPRQSACALRNHRPRAVGADARHPHPFRGQHRNHGHPDGYRPLSRRNRTPISRSSAPFPPKARIFLASANGPRHTSPPSTTPRGWTDPSLFPKLPPKKPRDRPRAPKVCSWASARVAPCGRPSNSTRN